MAGLAKAMKQALDDSDLHDIRLVTKDDNGMTCQISASRYVLSMRSRVFKKMLLGSFKEASMDRIVISDDFSYSTMKGFVHYLYTDELDDVDNNFEFTVNIFNAAQYYEVDDLMDLILSTFHKRLKKNSCSSLLHAIFYTAIHIVDSEDKGKIIYRFMQKCLQVFFCGKDVPYEKIEDLKCIPLHLIFRVFNNNTVAGIDETKPSRWLKALNVWASQSEENMTAARDLVHDIDKKHIDAEMVAELYKTGSSFLSKDITLDILLEFVSNTTQRNKKRKR